MSTVSASPQRVPITSATWEGSQQTQAWLDANLPEDGGAQRRLVVCSKFPLVAGQVGLWVAAMRPALSVDTRMMFPHALTRESLLPDDTLCLVVTSEIAHSGDGLFPFHLDLFSLGTFRRSKNAWWADAGFSGSDWIAARNTQDHRGILNRLVDD